MLKLFLQCIDISTMSSTTTPIGPAELHLATAREAFVKHWSAPATAGATCLDDFEPLRRTIGEGSFGQVALARHREDGTWHAIKVMSKAVLARRGEARLAVTERRILAAVNSPFLMRLQHSFKDAANLYLVLEYAPGCDLFDLHNHVRLTERNTPFYAAQVVFALEYLHKVGIIYRDLKPENLVVCRDGYLKLTDFGGAIVEGDAELTASRTFVGTPFYMAPELIQKQAFGTEVDWWAFGVVVFDLNSQKLPFRCLDDPDYKKTYSAIVAVDYSCPATFSASLCHLVGQLLQPVPSSRLGSRGTQELKRHEWFSNIDWRALYEKAVQAPFIPVLKEGGEDAARYFPAYKDIELVEENHDPRHERLFEEF